MVIYPVLMFFCTVLRDLNWDLKFVGSNRKVMAVTA